MDDEPPDAAAHAGEAEGSPSSAQQQQQNSEERAEVIVIAARGAVVLDVLFDGLLPPAPVAGTAPLAHRRRRLVVPFRVDAVALAKHSRYFANLLDNTRFQEARAVKATLEGLAREGVEPAEEPADAGSRLPRVSIEVACENRATGVAAGVAATRTVATSMPRVRTAGAGKGRTAKPAAMRRDQVFAELLRVLHWDGVDSGRQGGGNRGSKPATLTRRPSLPANALAKKTPRTPRKGIVADTVTRSPKPSPTCQKAMSSEPAPVPPFLPGSRWSAKTPPTLAELAELAMLADRFACTSAVATFVRTQGVRLPQGAGRGGAVTEEEEFLRQKVYVAWLLDQPLWFHTATRALVLSGSERWATSSDDVDGGSGGGGVEDVAPWWDLPDGLELELQFRRQCIVDCIASVPRHFLARYARRNGGNGPQKGDNASSGQGQLRYRLQCTMGYESSAACDSFQLGEMVKFLMIRGLLSFQDFSCSLSPSFSPPAAASFAYTGDVHHLLTTLRQCPAYQLDKHHVNCGLRPRLLPVLEFLQGMLAAGAIGLHRHEWALAGHGEASWLAAAEAAPTDSGEDEDSTDDDADAYDGRPLGYGNYGRVPVFRKPRPPGAAERRSGFRFTRSVAGDQRLRMAGTLGADKMARQLFTARKWNWTPET